MNRIIPEKRSLSNYDNYYTRKIENGIEYCNKDYYNSDFSRKCDLEEIEKLILLEQISETIRSDK